MRLLRIRDRFAIVGIGLLCLPLLLVFGPLIEETREEVRQVQAYNITRQIQERMAKDPDDGSLVKELDPWGNPYQFRRGGDGAIRVLSSGSNGESPVDGVDEDDIYPDMPVSPGAKIRRQKRMQWLISLAATTGVFLLVVTVYLSSRRIPE